MFISKNRAQAIQLLENIPENDLAFVIEYIQGLIDRHKKRDVEEIEPDELDLKMIETAVKNNNGSTISFEELLRKDGFDYNDL